MNTEIFDYFKALSKKEFFFVNAADTILGLVIIISAIISFRQGATMTLYAIMFSCATVMLGLNSYKCFKRKSKNGWVFAILCFAFLLVSLLAVYCVVKEL